MVLKLYVCFGKGQHSPFHFLALNSIVLSVRLIFFLIIIYLCLHGQIRAKIEYNHCQMHSIESI